MKPAIKIILGIVAVLAVAGAAFYAGTVYGKNQATTSFAARRQGAFQGAVMGQGNQQGAGQARAGNMLFGKIKTVNPDGLVVTDSNNNEITVKVAGTTLIEKNMSVEVTDLAEGETVIISGSRGGDGTITARSLQVAPAGRFSAEGGPQAPPDGQGQGGLPQGGLPPGAVPLGGDAPRAP